MIDNHFYRVYNLIKKYVEIRDKEILDIFHEKIKCRELLSKLSESRNNILSDKRKLIFLNKIKNEVEYIKIFLLKKEYKQKVEFKFLDYDGQYLDNYLLIRDKLYYYYLDGDIVYEILKKQKNINNHFDITDKIINSYLMMKDDKVFKDIEKIITKFHNYFKDYTEDEDENININEYYAQIARDIEY